MMQHHFIWNQISKYFSVTYSRKFLQERYKRLDIAHADKLAYKNCYPFIYYLEHGRKYFEQANTALKEILPILLFYGTIQLMKAVLLTVDPFYPNSSQVLAHGVSTRKRKKNAYLFLFDEVKLQKNGLFLYSLKKIFSIKEIPGQKYKMRQLLLQIPELHALFYSLENKPVSYKLSRDCDNNLRISEKILDEYHLTLSSFQHYFCKIIGQENCHIFQKKNELIIKNGILHPNIQKKAPILFDSEKKMYLLADRGNFCTLPELMSHYLILYNLSMICRYETEWWGELFHHYPETDYPFIESFLNLSIDKTPQLILDVLNGSEI